MIHRIKIRHRTVKMKETIINRKAPEKVLFLYAGKVKKADTKAGMIASDKILIGC